VAQEGLARKKDGPTCQDRSQSSKFHRLKRPDKNTTPSFGEKIHFFETTLFRREIDHTEVALSGGSRVESDSVAVPTHSGIDAARKDGEELPRNLRTSAGGLTQDEAED
jgi:hypothetical protein